jgi:hypothetical protein
MVGGYLNSGPFVTTIYLRQKADLRQVHGLLDQAA